jgi:hypothetical protein
LIRAMNEVYHRTKDPGLKSYAKAYLSVQVCSELSDDRH